MTVLVDINKLPRWTGALAFALLFSPFFLQHHKEAEDKVNRVYTITKKFDIMRKDCIGYNCLASVYMPVECQISPFYTSRIYCPSHLELCLDKGYIIDTGDFRVGDEKSGGCISGNEKSYVEVSSDILTTRTTQRLSHRVSR